MRPIPKKLLIHSAEVVAVSQKDRWGNVTGESQPIVLKSVRFEPSSRIVKDKQNNDIQLASLLMYDCTNSAPKGQEFHYDDIISVFGERYQIVSIEKLFDEKRLHHLEIGMVRYGA